MTALRMANDAEAGKDGQECPPTTHTRKACMHPMHQFAQNLTRRHFLGATLALRARVLSKAMTLAPRCRICRTSPPSKARDLSLPNPAARRT